MITVEFATRCAALGRRGLSRDLVHDLKTAGDLVALEQLERATDADLAELTRLDAARRTTAAILTLQAAARPYVDAGRAFEERRCRLLCCPVPCPHDRTHPSCSYRPLLWQDEADQA